MINRLDTHTDFALDVNSIGKLRMAAKTDSTESLKVVAKQFEALFMNMLLKSMRDATPKDGLFDSSQSDLYTGILDQQMSQKFSTTGGLGLADMMVKQLTRNSVQPGDAPPVIKPLERNTAAANRVAGIPLPEINVIPGAAENPSETARMNSPKDFVEKMWPQAVDASKELGVPAHFLIGHAALESGWGRREIRDTAGNNSYNLFGIKAGKNWKGAVAEATTTEYVNGVATKSVERFRAYDSYADAFRDYADLLRNNPRYASALEQGKDAAGFAKGLQQGGYATDPLYASKITRILNSKTMQLALANA